ncbi:hypothetical protein ACFL0W_02595 [Nanoarchaeota archaeon]
MKTLSWFENKGMFIRDITIKRIAENYMKKARNNIITMELLSKVENHKDILDLPDDYEPEEWIVIAAYYAMYVAALSVLAKIGYKSKNHTATSLALETFFVKKKLLEKKYLESLANIKIKKEEIEELNDAREKREIAQYSPTKHTSKRIANEAREEAHHFVNRMEDLFGVL